jgi:hypothetical protein
VDWYEAQLSNGFLRVRCVAVASFELPQNARALTLHFGEVIAFRGSADPFNMENIEFHADLPHEEDRRLTSLFNFATDTPWARSASEIYPGELRHYILCDVEDDVLGILTRGGEPRISFE